ncbi:MAG: methyltransferase domain-containing protein [Candidatus Aenigmatarchaeota archaeon]
MDEELRDVWDTIADSWNNLRSKPQPEVVDFSRKYSGLVVDIGCGNCRNLISFKGKLVGIDFSKKMILEAKKFCEKRGVEVYLVIGDATNLPLKDSIADVIIYTSVISHLKKRDERLKSLKEIKRAGKDGFISILSIWNRWQMRFVWKLILGLFKGTYPDVYVDWNYHGKKYKRFYHLYTKKEMERDLKEVGFIIEKTFKSKGGVWFWIRK